jgi:DNA polymerase-3 subunit beta
MKVIVLYKNLFKSLQRVQSIVDRKEIRPILSQLLIKAKNNRIETCATNLEVSLRQFSQAEILQEGSIVLDAKKLYEIIREMPEKIIDIESWENNRVRISVGEIVFNIVGLEPSEFPETDFLDQEDTEPINANVLREMIEKTIYASSPDETRHNLNGVFFEKTTKGEEDVLRAVATDGHRLSILEKPVREINKKGALKADELKKGVIFPKKGLYELKKIIDEDPEQEEIQFLCREHMGFFKNENSTLAIRTIDEEFPNFSQAIPQESKTTIVMRRDEFLGALRRISVIAEERSKAVHLDIRENTMSIHASNPILGEGKEIIGIKLQGEDVHLGFNAGYLIDILNVIKDEQVVMRIKNNESPAVLAPLSRDDYTCIIMPMELND